MKKIAQLLLLLGLVVSFTSCLSMGLSSLLTNPKVEIPFSGTMNTTFGYENLYWGTSYDSIVKAGYPLTNKENDNSNKNQFSCYIGKSERVYSEYQGKYVNYDYEYGHGEVNETRMFFLNNRLYYVIDSFLTTPSMEYLHQRYGDFSEENLITAEDESARIIARYTNLNCEIPYYLSLMIEVYEDGTVAVHMFDLNMDTTLANETTALNKWVGYAAIDGANKKINYTFINKNSDGKCLFLGFSRSLDNPYASYVRGGFCWMNNTSGSYEIKIGTEISQRNYSTATWTSLYNGEKYTFTHNNGESARAFIEMVLLNDNLTLRHNGTVSEFICNGDQLSDIIAEFGIDANELFSAIENEEF